MPRDRWGALALAGGCSAGTAWTTPVTLPPGAHLSLAAPLTSAFESASKGIGFIPLTEARQIPVGSTLDTTAPILDNFD